MTVTLAPCPGCGGDVQFVSDASAIGRYAVQCRCGWSGPWVRSEAEARAEWNRRAPALRWRSEPPDAPGIWLQRLGITLQAMRLTDRGVAYYGPPEMRRLSEVRGWFWSGPIPEPEEPKE